MDFLKSVSKIVFLLTSITVCITFASGRLESKDFMVLASMAYAFYFSIKTPGNEPSSMDSNDIENVIARAISRPSLTDKSIETKE